VFKNQSLLHQLNRVVHPRLKKRFESWCQQHENSPYVLKEAAIVAKEGEIDEVIYVYASEETRMSRVLNRDPQRSTDQVRKIMASQMTEREFRALAGFVIDNESDLLIPQVLKLHKNFLTF